MSISKKQKEFKKLCSYLVPVRKENNNLGYSKAAEILGRTIRCVMFWLDPETGKVPDWAIADLKEYLIAENLIKG